MRLFKRIKFLFILTIGFNSILFSQSPGNVSGNLSLWLKADQGVTGTTPVTAWTDQTGTHPDAIQIADAPDLETNQVNFNPAIHFNGADDYLQITGGILGISTLNDIWVYSVSKANALTTQTLFYEATTSQRVAVLNPWNTQTFVVNSNNYNVTSEANIFEYNMWTHASSTGTATPRGTRKSISRDGTYLGAGSASNTSVTGNNSNFLIGGGWNNALGTSNNLNGRLAELIIYTGVPSPLEQEQIQTYLAIKYGITKNSADNVGTATEDERDYFASDGTTIIWDYSLNSAYHNNVTGIGRDDNSELDQRKSKNSTNKSRVTIDHGGGFGGDLDFLVWGNDGADGSSTDVTGYDVRSNRVWKTAVTGTPGNVSVLINISGMGFDLNSSSASDFDLLIDGDGVFNAGASVGATGATLVNGVLSFTSVSFSDGDFFAVAGPSNVAPGNVDRDLHLWLKADANVTGTAPVTAWTNQVGNTNDAIQVGDAPDLLSDDANFNPAVDFNGNNDYLQITDGIFDSTAYEDLFVYSVTKADALNNGTLLRETVTNGRYAVLNPWGNQTYIASPSNYNTTSGANTIQYSMWTHGTSTGTATPSGTRKSIARDGSFLGAGNSTNSFVIGNQSDLLIGAGWDNGLGTSNNFNGKLAELIVYASVPSALEQERIQSYLAIKYGITKNSADNVSTATEDERDYFASDGNTIIWDFSANNAYHNSVAGVGRDDASGLDQQKSKSSNNRSRVIIDKGLAFSNDKNFIVWGNDSANGTATDVIAGYDLRYSRIWKTAITGAPGSITFSIDLAGVGFDLVNSVVSDFALLIDDDGVFAPNAVAHTTGASLVNGVLSFTNVTFSDGDFFSIAGPTISEAPGDVKVDLQLWLKADEGVTGVTPVTAWADQSGNTADAIQVGDAPDFLTNQANFNPVVDFNGNNDYLQITGGMLGSSAFEDLFVYSIIKADALNNGTLLRETTSNGRYAILNPWGAQTYIASPANYNTTSGINTIEYSMWTHGTSTGTATPSGTRKSIARDGLFLGTGNSTNSFVTGNQSDLLIGAGWNNGLGTSNNFNGKLAELIVYAGVPSPLEQEKIQTYLAIKYGITKISEDNTSTVGQDERDYFASDGTTIIWDYSANSAYFNDIAGIGRDEASGLDQQKSKSIDNKSRVTMDKGGVFGSDKDFIVWGNDSAFGTSTDVPVTFDSRSNRIWKVAVTGTPGTVSMTVDLARIGFDLNNSVASDFALLIDDDGTFAPNAITHAIGTSLVNGVVSFPNVTFTDGDLFAIAGLSLSDAPGDVSLNLNLWLRADKGVTGSTPVTAWSDQSSSVSDAIQVGDAPDLLTDQINFNPAIDFNGNNDYLRISGGLLGLNTFNDLWIYAVSKADAFNNGTMLFEAGDNGRFAVLNPWGNQTYLFSKDAYNLLHGANTYEYNLWTHASSTSTATPSGTRRRVSRDGEYLASGNNTSTFITGNNSDLIIGGGWGNGIATDNNFNGKLAELIIYAGIPTELEQERIQSYLAVKYGITKNSSDNGGTGGQDERDYFASDATVTWDYSANSTYHNYVAGIGRDDNSGLDQRKSKSSRNKSRVTMDKGGAFSNDKDFIIWGHDSGLGVSSDVIAGYEMRSARVWKVDLTGTPGSVSFSIDLTGMGFDLKSGVAADFALLIDDDGTFAPNASAHTTGVALNKSMLTFTDVAFNDGDFFSIAGPEIENSPGNVKLHLNLWLKADEGISGASPVTAWVDQAGSEDDAVLVGDAPDLVSSQVNYNPVLDFNGNNDYLEIAGGILGTDAFNDIWIYSVCKANSINNSTMLYESAASNELAILNPWGTNTYIFSNGDYRVTSGANTEDYNIWTHASSTNETNQAGINKSIAKDGAYLGAGSGNGSLLVGNNSDLIIGAGWRNASGTSNNLNSKLAELIVYTEAPTPLEQERIQSYLALKYGITKNSADDVTTVGQDERDYFGSDGTVVLWDYSDNTSYNNDIIGIGRDSTGGLYQKQSKTSDDSLIIHVGVLSTSNQLNAASITNDTSYLIIGNNQGRLTSSIAGDAEVPLGIFSRLEREWKITNTNFEGDFTIEFEWDSAGTFELDSIRLLVDLDGDFTNATIFDVDDGLSFSNGSIIVSGINTSHIPANSTRFITLASTDLTGPLPIELLEFNAQQVTGQRLVRLDWRTATEINNDYFTVEKTRDGKNWDFVKNVDGAGNSSEVLSYGTNDTNPYSGTSYYRLKQTDFDGQTSYSNPKIITLSRQRENQLNIYPNPTKDQVTIEGTEFGEVKIFNALGQNVTHKVGTVDQTETKRVFDLSALSPGLYYFKARAKAKKVYKQ